MTPPAPVGGHDDQIADQLSRLLARHADAGTDFKSAQALWDELFDAGLAWVDFPRGLGGLGRPAALQQDVERVLSSSDAPRPEIHNLIGTQLMAPTIAAFGTVDQQERFLRAAFTCREIWCQLFSEPGAGSDLASLSTRAERQGDTWVVNGQKVWSTLAHVADRAILLARTEPDAPKHAGLTFFALDMRQPGVDVRPLRQITGDAEYNEVFLTDAEVPDGDRIGEPGQGWKIAMATLMSERGVSGVMSRGQALNGLLDRLTEAWRAAPEALRTPVNLDRLVRLWVEARVIRLTAERAEATTGRPGPEGSIVKNVYGKVAQGVFDLCLELRGPAGMLVDTYELVQPSTFTHMGGAQTDHADPGRAFLAARALTIAGGTTEVNMNVLGERVLGLPQEPRPTHAPATTAVRRNS